MEEEQQASHEELWFTPDEGDDITKINTATADFWALSRRQRQHARAFITQHLEEGIKAPRVPNKPAPPDAYPTGYYIAQSLMNTDSWADPARKPHLINLFKILMKRGVRPNAREPLLESELSYSGLPNFRTFKKCADYNAGICTKTTSGYCGSPEQPLIHVCARKMIDGFHCSRPHPHIKHDEYIEREECLRERNDLPANGIFPPDLICMEKDLIKTAKNTLYVGKDNAIIQTDVEHNIRKWKAATIRYREKTQAIDKQGQRYTKFYFHNGTQENYWDITEYKDSGHGIKSNSLSDNYMYTSDDTLSASTSATTKPLMVYHPRFKGRESNNNDLTSDSDHDTVTSAGIGRGALLRSLSMNRKPGTLTGLMSYDSDSSLFSDIAVRNAKPKPHLTARLTALEQAQTPCNINKMQEEETPPKQMLPYGIPNTKADLIYFMNKYNYQEVMHNGKTRILVPKQLTEYRGKQFIKALGRAKFIKYKGAEGDQDLYIPDETAQREWEQAQRKKSLNTQIADSALRRHTKIPVQRTSTPTREVPPVHCSTPKATSTTEAPTTLWRVHAKPGELTTIDRAKEKTKISEDVIHDDHVEIATELRDYNAKFLAEFEKFKPRQDMEGQEARPTFSNGAPHYGCWKEEQPGGKPTKENCSPVTPAGIRIGDMALPNHIWVKGQTQHELGKCIYPDFKNR